MPINNETLQQQLINDLLIESFESLDNFDRELLLLEKNEGSPDTFNVIFRVIHTIKGTAGCIGLGKIESVAHVGESLLSLLRDGKLKVTPPLISTLLEYSDALKDMMRCLEKTGKEGDVDYTGLLDKLQSLQNGDVPIEVVEEKDVEKKEEPAANAGWGLFGDDEPVTPVSVASPAPPVATPVHATEAAPVENAPARGGASISDTAIRVEVGQLDKLMNLVGELVLARNQIVQFTTKSKDPTLLNASQRLNIITTELQENVMKTRMQPIENVWAKFPRIVRDIARELGKRLQLVMEGSETELDRTIIEAIKDPLTHIIRNSIDHGIELPEVRRKAGKPEEGILILRAFHEGGQVNIEIMDDGAGINLQRVKQKAIEKGLITAEQAGRMTDREVFNLIFLPGFSTAEKITNVSGRGVGMDVVKTNIEKIGGSVDLLSEEGQGTTLKIKIPLTLAIIPALIISCGSERFAIPQVSLLELVRLDGDQAKKGIEMLYGSPVYRLRGRLLPLIYLNRELQIEPDEKIAKLGVISIVVLQADGRQFGMIVDRINDTEEIVVKPLGKQHKGISCYAGATIMGDGKVALILDVLGLAQHANVISEVRDRAVLDQSKSQEHTEEKQTLLVFDAKKDSRMAIPLSMVARLEEFPRTSIEHCGDHEVVQYRGQILPLIEVAKYLPDGVGHSLEAADPMQVVVYTDNGRSVGLVVEKIKDIIQEALTVKLDVRRQGVVGSVVIQDKVTDLLDVPAIIGAAEPEFYEAIEKS